MKLFKKGSGQLSLAFSMYPIKKKIPGNRVTKIYVSLFEYFFNINILFTDLALVVNLDVPFLTNTMVSIAEGIPLLGLQPELASTAL